MKVIEEVKNLRTGETTEVSWGNKIESDLSIISSVAGILSHQRDRDDENIHEALLGRFETIAIRIEL
jgi:hypothetical protein